MAIELLRVKAHIQKSALAREAGRMVVQVVHNDDLISYQSEKDARFIYWALKHMLLWH
ncbi:MAG: hypothetical protein PVJ84_15125 [Desulfobacteraceae bacterium]